MKETDIFIHLKILPENEVRPLWSILIPTHNCADFLKETLKSILEQDQGPEKMEIIVVDDCSTKDDPEVIVRELGKGRVKFFRQTKNVGKVRNYETGLQLSKGILIHQLHGDDKVRQGFYQHMEKIFSDYPDVSAAFCRSIYIDENGIWKQLTGVEQYKTGILNDVFERLIINQIIQTPAMVVKRSVYESIGAFDRRFNCMEDREMWIRIAYHYKIAFVNKVLAEYRTHSNNATSQTILNGNLLDAHRLLSRIILTNYKDKIKKYLISKRKHSSAVFFIDTIKSSNLPKNIYFKYLKYILKLKPNLRLLYRLFSNQPNFCF